jgi:hypothetical protein
MAGSQRPQCNTAPAVSSPPDPAAVLSTLGHVLSLLRRLNTSAR